jgi:hypothetical protein
MNQNFIKDPVLALKRAGHKYPEDILKALTSAGFMVVSKEGLSKTTVQSMERDQYDYHTFH